jgi:hypothetical protein
MTSKDKVNALVEIGVALALAAGAERQFPRHRDAAGHAEQSAHGRPAVMPNEY